ncbi:hypothetical protein GCM10010294_24910 [Streptomyces griseoloalbus]|uniref:phage tail protein n=1 Tax=Streptomyces griseoloalbus TaxID=67303 RepID=UPI0018739804|nr:hypothetical protein GCM10010294_24910 [Streptomyces griseoloalbus]
MALTIGELVGFIRADDEGFVRGLSNAQLRMRGLQRDTEGRLRDLRGRFITEGEAAGRGLGDGIRAHAEAAAPAVKKVGLALAAVGVGIPAVTAAGAALGGLAAGAAAAGIAVKAFTLAAQPQLDAVAESSAAAEKAEKAHETATRKKAAAQALAAKGGDEYKAALREAASATKAAKDADAAYEQQLAGLPAPTREYAMALQGLKTDHQAWSDSLAGTTMPVFTKGIQVLRDLLPTLTPFVKGAAEAFGGFLDEVSAGVKSAGFKEWAADMSAAAGPALANFLEIIKNLAIGFGGLLQAFLPASDGVTGGLVDMTAAFADWGASLKDSEGFAQFLDLAREGGQTLGTLAGAAMELLVALSPLIGVTAQVALLLAELINKIPPDVLLGIAAGFTAIKLAVMAYGTYTRIVAAATRAWAAAQALWSAITMASPIGLIIALIVGLIAVVVIAYQKSETFRTVVQAVWAAVRSAIGTAVDWIMDKVQWFNRLPFMIGRWFGQAKDWAIQKWNELVAWVRGVPGRVSSALSGLAGTLRGRASEAGRALVSAIRGKLSEAVQWVRGLPGRARSALGNLGGLLRGAGQALIRGFINGIKSMIGSVRDAASSAVSAARNFFPFSPAKEGPFSGSGYTTHSGRALIQGFQRGITDQLPKLRAQMGGVMGGLPPLALPGHARAGVSALPGAAMAGALPQERRIVLEVQNGAGGRVEALLTHIIRETVAVKGGGDVQAAFGRKR